MKLSLIACALCVSSIAFASPTTGSLVTVRCLDPHQGVIYQVELKGGEITTIDIQGGTPGANLDCELYEGVDVIAKDKGPKSACHMSVTPSKTGKYALVIVNHGDTSETMTLTVQ